MKTLNLFDEGPLPLVDSALIQASGRAVSIPEKFLTIAEAAEAIGVEAWKLRRAAKQGAFPSYTLLNSRRLVKLSEVMAAIEASRQGGAE
jgi:excisionase family DNA binding protein